MDRKTCFKCGYESETELTKCPRCGTGLKSRSMIRGLGVVLVFLGGILVAGMAFLIFWTTNMIANSDRPGATSRFTGSKSDMMFMYSIFGLVLVFGLTSLVAGLWQVIFGRRNLMLVWIMLGLGAAFMIAGTIVQTLT